MLTPIIFATLMLPGLAGVIIPLFPGVPYMWLLALTYGIITDFSRLTLEEFAVLSILAGATLLVDYLSGIIGAKLGGASVRSLGFGIIGLIIGLLILPPFGGIPGLFLGILFNEVRSYSDRSKALRSATGSVLGAMAGMLINLVLNIAFITYFVIATI